MPQSPINYFLHDLSLNNVTILNKIRYIRNLFFQVNFEEIQIKLRVSPKFSLKKNRKIQAILPDFRATKRGQNTLSVLLLFCSSFAFLLLQFCASKTKAELCQNNSKERKRACMAPALINLQLINM